MRKILVIASWLVVFPALLFAATGDVGTMVPSGKNATTGALANICTNASVTCPTSGVVATVSGATNSVTKITGTGTIGASSITDNGTTIALAEKLVLDGAANTTALSESGYSLTGSATTVLASMSGTLNTTGVVPCVICYNLTTTAYGTNSALWALNGGSVGTTPYLTVLANGNIGILTNTPDAPLEIFYNVQDAVDTPVHIFSNSSTTGTSYTRLRLEKGSGYGGDINGFLNQGVGSGLSFNVLLSGTSTEVMRILSSGNVGIGTTTPGSVLQINGGAAVGYSASTAAPTNGALVNGLVETPSGFVATGSTPTGTGICPINTQVGGNTAGSFKSNGACAAGTVILTFATAAPTGWVCSAHDMTTPADLMNQTAYSTTSCTLTGTMANADQVTFDAKGF